MKSRVHWLTQPALIAAVIAIVVVGLLYSTAVSLPLFSDDLVQIPWLESISWGELWTSPSPYGYYRPLWYTIWRGWGGLVGGLHPRGLHTLNLVAHAFAAWVTGLLAVRWLPVVHADRERAVAAGCAVTFFVVFPFSRQAVAWPGAVYNPMVSGLSAAAVLLYDSGRNTGSDWRIGSAALLAGLTPFIYESGLLVAPLLLLVEMIGRVRGRWQRRSRWPIALVGVSVITLVLWRSMRGAGVAPFGLRLGHLWHNGGYLAQGLIYPLAPVGQRLVVWTDLPPPLALWLVAVPAVLVLAWLGIRQCPDMFLLGTVWFGLFSLPPLVSMEAEWFALAPRFLYMTATGAALVWTAALLGRMTRAPSSRHAIGIALLCALLLIPAACFVRDGMALYRMAGQSIWQAAAAVTEGQRVLLVNLPRSLTPESRIYPLGFEGVTPLPMRVTAEELAYVHTGVRNGADAVAFGVVAVEEPKGYTYELFGQPVGWQELAGAVRDADSVYLTRYGENSVHLVEAGELEVSGSEIGPQVDFGDGLRLLGATWVCEPAVGVRLTAWWQSGSDLDTDVSVYAHLLGPDGLMVSQADGRPLHGMLPFWLLRQGEVVRDVRTFDPVATGSYTIRVGIWEPATGERWEAAGHPDGAVMWPVECP